jgi:predicted ATPase
LILFLDDLQWADSGSISLLHYVCKRLAGSRVLILGAYRPEDLALWRRESGLAWERHPLEPVRLELQREFGEIELDLDSSDRNASDRMALIDTLVDSETNNLGETFRQTLFRLTNGNPLFAVELLRTLKESGGLVRNSDDRWVEGRQFSWEKLPARLEAVIAERISRLPPIQQALLRAASVQGETFTVEVLADVLRRPRCQVVEWLSGLLSREQQIVEAINYIKLGPAAASQPPRFSQYRFRHGVFQKYLYTRLDPAERSSLHAETAVALENLSGLSSSEIALQLAWHFEQAGLIPRAVEYLLSASKQAIQSASHQQAAALFDRCLELIQQLPDSPVRTRLEVQVGHPYTS